MHQRLSQCDGLSLPQYLLNNLEISCLGDTFCCEHNWNNNWISFSSSFRLRHDFKFQDSRFFCFFVEIWVLSKSYDLGRGAILVQRKSSNSIKPLFWDKKIKILGRDKAIVSKQTIFGPFILIWYYYLFFQLIRISSWQYSWLLWLFFWLS